MLDLAAPKPNFVQIIFGFAKYFPIFKNQTDEIYPH